MASAPFKVIVLVPVAVMLKGATPLKFKVELDIVKVEVLTASSFVVTTEPLTIVVPPESVKVALFLLLVLLPINDAIVKFPERLKEVIEEVKSAVQVAVEPGAASVPTVTEPALIEPAPERVAAVLALVALSVVIAPLTVRVMPLFTVTVPPVDAELNCRALTVSLTVTVTLCVAVIIAVSAEPGVFGVVPLPPVQPVQVPVAFQSPLPAEEQSTARTGFAEKAKKTIAQTMQNKINKNFVNLFFFITFHYNILGYKFKGMYSIRVSSFTPHE